MSDIKRILVPTDFSEPADAALSYALDLAARLGATVSLIHVFEDLIEQSPYPELYIPLAPALRDELLQSVNGRLNDRVARGGAVAMSSEICFGAAAQAIVDAARTRDADLIVMGTHGRHGVAHLLMGSVAERVLRTAACPVLTVRSTATARAEKAA